MLNAPGENLKLPDVLLKKVESIRNQITLGEADIRRLKDLVVAETYTIEQLNKSKIALSEEIAELEIKHKEAKQKLLELTAKTVDTENTYNKANLAAKEIINELEQIDLLKNKLLELIK